MSTSGYIRLPITGGPLAIGSAITGGGNNRILYQGVSGLLSATTDFTWNESTGTLTANGAGGISTNGNIHCASLYSNVIVNYSTFSSDNGNFYSDGAGTVQCKDFHSSSITNYGAFSSDNTGAGGTFFSDGMGGVTADSFTATYFLGPAAGPAVMPTGLNVSGGIVTDSISSYIINGPLNYIYSDGGAISSDASGTLSVLTLNATYVAVGLSGVSSSGPIASSGGLSITGGASINTLTVSGIGSNVSVIVASIQRNAQAASIGTTTLVTGTSLGHYLVTVYLVATTAGTSGTVSATLGWTDAGGARTQATGNITFGTLGAPVTLLQYMVTTISAITYSTTVTSAIGSPKYELAIDVVKQA